MSSINILLVSVCLLVLGESLHDLSGLTVCILVLGKSFQDFCNLTVCLLVQERKNYKPVTDYVPGTGGESFKPVTGCGALDQEDWTVLSSVWKKLDTEVKFVEA